MASSREFALYFLVSLLSCFDHFIGLFDYSVGRSILSCSDTKTVFPKKYGSLILAGEGQTDPRKSSTDRRMIAIVDDEELEKRKSISNTANTSINRHRGQPVSGLNGRRNVA